MMITGYFYMHTNANTNEDAYRSREIGLNIDNITSLVVRDKNGDDLTAMKIY